MTAKAALVWVAVLISLAGCAQGDDSSARTTTSRRSDAETDATDHGRTTTPAVRGDRRCSPPVPADRIPAAIQTTLRGETAYGVGDLWVAGPPDPSWVTREAPDRWRLKMGWLTPREGEVTLEARLQGPDGGPSALTVEGSVSEAAESVHPSTIDFPQAGCWEIVGRLEGQAEAVEFLILVE